MLNKHLAVALAGTLLLTTSMASSAAPDRGRPDKADQQQDIFSIVADANADLAASGYDFELYMVEYITSGTTDQMGRTVFLSDRGNKRLLSHWVPFDPRRGSRSNITWRIDEGDHTLDANVADPSAAISAAMNTWDAESCSSLPLTDLGATQSDEGIVQAIFGFGGDITQFSADILHGGWLPAAFWDLVATGGSNFILGATFTFNWVNPDGSFTDIDNNSRNDTAFREVYYNDNFSWDDIVGNVPGNFDVETVALHEVGHGLSQAHYGEIFASPGNNRLHFSPRAVMNAAYTGDLRTPLGTDVGGHCTNWGSWPNN